jgi:ribosomal protein S18 acetylase RimI-like enzyme
MNETIRSFESVPFAVLCEAFQKAFVDYEVHVNDEELRSMLSRRGFDPSLSFGLFENDQLKSFILNGIGKFNGQNTAYDAGTGTLEECRGKGYATRIFNYGLPFLKQAGIQQYLLEVLQHNTGAISVYKKLGFVVTREFNYFTQQASGLMIPVKILPSDYFIWEIELKHDDEIKDFDDFTPSWQNSFESVCRRINDFKIIGAYHEEKLVGYCIFEPGSGDVTRIGVEQSHRRLGIASVMLTEVLKFNKHTTVKVINTETGCQSITQFLKSCNLPLRGKQFEMIKLL